MPSEFINNNQVPVKIFTSMPEQNVLQSESGSQNQVSPILPSRKRKWKIILLTFIGVIIFGGVAFGGFYVYENIWPNSPENLFWQSLENFKIEDRMSLDGNLKYTMTTLQSSSTNSAFNVFSDLVSGTDQKKGSLIFSTKYDRTDPKNILSDSQITLDLSSISFRLLTRIIGKDLYLKMMDQNLSMLGSFITIPDSWVHIDINQKEQEFLSQNGLLDGDKSAISLEDIFNIIRNSQPFRVELLDKNDQSFAQQAYVYKIIWSREGFDKMLQDIVSAIPDEQRKTLLTKRLEPLSDDEWDRLVSTEMKIWILKKDKLLRQISFYYNRDEVDMIGQHIDATLQIAMQSLQEPLKVETPSGAMSLEDLMKQMFSTFTGSFDGSANINLNSSSTLFSDFNIEQQNNYQKDARRVADIKQIQIALELYYADQNGYPIYNGSAIKLGDTTNTCLSSSGGSGFSASCSGTTYMGNVPNDPEFPKFYYNYLSDGNNYLIEFYLSQDVGNLKTGVNYASNMGGISSDWKKVQSIYGGTPGGVYVPLDNNQTDDPSKFISPIDTDNDQLDDLQEVVYGTDQSNLDTDGDGYSDGVEVQNGYNPLGEGKL